MHVSNGRAASNGRVSDTEITQNPLIVSFENVVEKIGNCLEIAEAGAQFSQDSEENRVIVNALQCLHNSCISGLTLRDPLSSRGVNESRLHYQREIAEAFCERLSSCDQGRSAVTKVKDFLSAYVKSLGAKKKEDVATFIKASDHFTGFLKKLDMEHGTAVRHAEFKRLVHAGMLLDEQNGNGKRKNGQPHRSQETNWIHDCAHDVKVFVAKFRNRREQCGVLERLAERQSGEAIWDKALEASDKK